MDDETQRFMRHYWAQFKSTLGPNEWLGVPCWQNPCDAWIIQELIAETRPDVIVETGTAGGGSALLWVSLLAMFGDGQVITVDTHNQHEAASKVPIWERVTYIKGTSSNPEIVAEVAAQTEGRRVMVVLDSDHSADHVLRELDLWAPLVTRDCYLVVQDGIVTYVDESFLPGPLEALQKWLPEHPEFVVDEGRERMMMTLCPSGFLKRVGLRPRQWTR